MAWPNLKSKLNSLPLVLAGPILRRVTSTSVTVWVATREHATVTLDVYGDDAKTIVKSESRPTIAIGTNVHIVAVTARSTDKLDVGEIYTYELTFKSDLGTQSLAQATAYVPLSYSTLGRPSFVLPADKPGDLRIMQGSCRKPHGDGGDALAILDALIEETSQAATRRPQQLVLSGDQIYADDVADCLLILITDAASALFGWPSPPGVGVRSAYISDAGFTTDDKRSHLISFPEFVVMYLFAWSNVLWSAPPTLEDALGEFGDIGAGSGAETEHVFDNAGRRDTYKAEQANVVSFLGTLPLVRRALANIPTYMICDDHEVTDDWNMTRSFCDNVYGSSNGARLIQNGLVAFALCQAWGNTPEQFDDVGGDAPAGLQLLRLLDTGDADQYDSNSKSLAKLVGVHDKQALSDHASGGTFAVFHEPGNDVDVHGISVPTKSLNFHYTVEGAAHQIIVTDSRTWRSFPGGDDDPPILIPDEIMAIQIGAAPPLGDRVQMLVVTTNMPPLAGVRAVEDSWLLQKIAGIYGSDLWDSWSFPTPAFDRMVRWLAGRLPTKDGAFTGGVVVLSGDVHFGFTNRFSYIGTTSPKAKVAFAQLVASALKNESDKTRVMHDGGFESGPHKGAKGWLERRLSPKWVTEQYAGWENLTESRKVGYETVIITGDDVVVQGKDPRSVDPSAPTLRVDADTHLDGPADFHYRLDYLSAAAGGQYADTPPSIGDLSDVKTTNQRIAALGEWTKAATAYLDYKNKAGSGQQIVGHNNLGEITFAWGDGDHKLVAHTLRWQGGGSNIQWVSYHVPLAPEVTGFEIEKADGE